MTTHFKLPARYNFFFESNRFFFKKKKKKTEAFSATRMRRQLSNNGSIFLREPESSELARQVAETKISR